MIAKDQILIIYKDQKTVTKNQEFWNDKFSNKFNVNHLYLYDYIHLTNKNIIDVIKKKITELKVDKIMFEGDHLSLIDYNFIKSFEGNLKKGLFCGDDTEWHQVNLLTGCACDFVLTDPVSSLKFNELGIRSIFSTIEANDNIFKDYKLEKEIDVLFFGRDKTDRKDYIDLLKENNINYLSVNPYLEISDTMEKLAKLINKSKIVINLTKSSNGSRYYNPSSALKYGYFFKGRIIMVGMCNSLCVSEYAPSVKLLFPNNELPTFSSKKEFLEIVKDYLNNKQKLAEDTKKYHLSSMKYSDKNYVNKLYEFINEIKKKDEIEVKIPIWYYYLTIRQHFRLRAKFIKIKSFFLQFFENFQLPIYTYPINILFFLRFLPNLIFKKIF